MKKKKGKKGEETERAGYHPSQSPAGQFEGDKGKERRKLEVSQFLAEFRRKLGKKLT